MKNLVLILLFFNVIKADISAQIRVALDTLKLSQISVVLPKNFSRTTFDSFLTTGPDAEFCISITNKSDSLFMVYYDEWVFGCFYSYKKKTYESVFVTFKEPFVNRWLMPDEIFLFKLKECIFLDYETRVKENEEDYDYTEEMLEIIPTIRVYAISPDKKLFISDQCKNIVITKKESDEKG